MDNRCRVAADEIYDAIIDAEGLAQLPGRLAVALGGRSALIHWHHSDGTAQVLAHCGYYSREQMATYERDFCTIDPWAKAAARGREINSAMNLEELVSVNAFESSVFYNEFIREIGDDTCRGMGVHLQTAWGSGMIAIHRGRTQDPFAQEEVAALNEVAVHLRRMLTVQGRLSAADRESKTLQGILDGMPFAALVITGEGRLLHFNAAGQYLISGSPLLTYSCGRIEARGPAGKWLRASLRAATGPAPTAGAVDLGYLENKRAVATVSPMRLPNGARCAMLLCELKQETDQALAQRLCRLFGLTRAEAEVAVYISNGLSLAQIAEDRRVAISTVRAQLKQIAAKMECSRQSQIVSVLRSIVPA